MDKVNYQDLPPELIAQLKMPKNTSDSVFEVLPKNGPFCLNDALIAYYQGTNKVMKRAQMASFIQTLTRRQKISHVAKGLYAVKQGGQE